MVSKDFVLCPVCRVFDQATGHCRPKVDFNWPNGLPDYVKRKVYICDTFERKFFKSLGRQFCAHGRSLYEVPK